MPDVNSQGIPNAGRLAANQAKPAAVALKTAAYAVCALLASLSMVAAADYVVLQEGTVMAAIGAVGIVQMKVPARLAHHNWVEAVGIVEGCAGTALAAVNGVDGTAQAKVFVRLAHHNLAVAVGIVERSAGTALAAVNGVDGTAQAKVFARLDKPKAKHAEIAAHNQELALLHAAGVHGAHASTKAPALLAQPAAQEA